MFRDGFLSLVVDALLLALASSLGALIPCFLFGIPFADAMCTAAFGVAFECNRCLDSRANRQRTAQGLTAMSKRRQASAARAWASGCGAPSPPSLARARDCRVG